MKLRELKHIEGEDNKVHYLSNQLVLSLTLQTSTLPLGIIHFDNKYNVWFFLFALLQDPCKFCIISISIICS